MALSNPINPTVEEVKQSDQQGGLGLGRKSSGKRLQRSQDRNHKRNERYIDPFYLPLQDSDEIRLLQLHPKSWGERITCTGKRVKLSDGSPYEALSYMWGSARVLYPITIGRRKLYVRENLRSALRHLRLESEIRVLWIDAICINQRNIHERNHQVAQMGMIYNRATRVVVWLGASDTASSAAFRALNNWLWTHLIQAPNTSAGIIKVIDQLLAIHSLLSRNYWKRLWIVQEFLNSRDFVIWCGNDTCSGFRMTCIMERITNASKKLRYTSIPGFSDMFSLIQRIDSSTPARLFRLRRLRATQSPDRLDFKLLKTLFGSALTAPLQVPLFVLFSEFSESECEDQRDKIYGLHGLASSCCRAAIPIDYSLPWPIILTRLIRHRCQSNLFFHKLSDLHQKI
jgi:hypothetical protein